MTTTRPQTLSDLLGADLRHDPPLAAVVQSHIESHGGIEEALRGAIEREGTICRRALRRWPGVPIDVLYRAAEAQTLREFHATHDADRSAARAVAEQADEAMADAARAWLVEQPGALRHPASTQNAASSRGHRTER